MATWKDNATVLVLSEIVKRTKDPELRKILVQSRRDFISIRAGQERQFKYFYIGLFNNINAYLRGKKILTNKNYSELNKLIDTLFASLVVDQVNALNNNLLRSVNVGSHISVNYFKLLVSRAGIAIAPEMKEKLLKVIENSTLKTFDLVLDYSWGKKKTTLSRRIWRANRSSRLGIKNIVQYYQINNINDPRLLAKDLEGYLRQSTPVSKKLRKLITGLPKNVSYEALRLARSEINQGFSQSLYNSSQQTYGYRGIYWVLSSRHPEFDICTVYANFKKYGEKGFFPVGSEPRVPHPNCLCVQVADFGDIDKTVNELIGWTKHPNKYKNMDRYIKTLNRKAEQI